MNSTALQIYSFFMRMDLQFVRYCHASYSNRQQWLLLLKKMKLNAEIPVCSVLPQKSGYALYLHPADSNCTIPAVSKETVAACCTLLHCLPHTISPLGLLFDAQNACPIYLHPALKQAEHWCFSPCSDTSTVLMTQEVFLQQFLPLTKHDAIWNALSE